MFGAIVRQAGRAFFKDHLTEYADRARDEAEFQCSLIAMLPPSDEEHREAERQAQGLFDDVQAWVESHGARNIKFRDDYGDRPDEVYLAIPEAIINGRATPLSVSKMGALLKDAAPGIRLWWRDVDGSLCLTWRQLEGH